MTSASASLRPVARLVWRLVASTGHPLCLEHIHEDPDVTAACRQAHDSCQRVLMRLCELGHLVHDGGAAYSRAFWWGPGCVLPAGEPDYPRFHTSADTARALRRMRLAPVESPLDKVALPVRPGCQDFRAHPSRRGDRLVFRDGSETPAPAASLTPLPAGEPA